MAADSMRRRRRLGHGNQGSGLVGRAAAERGGERLDRLRNEAVMGPRAAPPDVDEPGFAEDPEMVGDGRLREPELVDEYADADFRRAREPVDDRDARGIGERLEPRGERSPLL